MNFHLLELFGSELARFVDNVLGHTQLANVMQKGCGPQGFSLACR